MAQTWLGQLRYKYKNIYKDIFIDKYEQLNITKDCKSSLSKIKELKLYIVEFEETVIIKYNIYLPEYIVQDNYSCSIII